MELQTAVIAAAVGLVTAVLGTSATWSLERRRWLTGLKANLQVDVQKTRLLSYPEAFKIFGKISTRATESLNSTSALRVAGELNDWIYSAGGMSADASTRGAALILRELLLKWHKVETTADLVGCPQCGAVARAERPAPDPTMLPKGGGTSHSCSAKSRNVHDRIIQAHQTLRILGRFAAR